MEKSSPVIFPITTILLDKASSFYDKYGKYVKWSAYGVLTMFGINYILDWYIGDKKVTPPPAADTSTSSPPAALAPPPVEHPRRPKIFLGLDGPVEFPNLKDQDSIARYVQKHSELSQKCVKEKKFDLASYHSSLLMFIHPNPMAYFELNSGYLSRDSYDLAKISLHRVLNLIEKQLKEEDEQASSS